MKILEDIGGKVKYGRDQVKNVHNKLIGLVTTPFDSWNHNSTLAEIYKFNIDRVKWYTNYALYGAEILALGYVFSSIGFAVGVNVPNMVYMGISGALVGGVIRGNSACPAQQKIEKYPLLDTSVGVLNGLLCCAMYSVAMGSLGSMINPVWAGQLIGFAAVTFASSHIMCNIEQFAFKVSSEIMKSRPASASTSKSEEKTDKSFVEKVASSEGETKAEQVEKSQLASADKKCCC